MKVYFIGIGGIGVSALAQYYLAKGHKVTGSDLGSSEITDQLRKKGVKIKIGPHKRENLPREVDLLIYSPAVQSKNPELLKARARKIKIESYPQNLGFLTKQYFTISVSGTHGKSTTTAMVALILIKAGLDPTVILGTKLKELDDSNYRVGNSRYLVIEADEWGAAFLNYWPNIIVLTNIEREHLDFYKNLNHILKTYRNYISHLSKDGILIANRNDKNIRKLFRRLKSPNTKSSTMVEDRIYFSFGQKREVKRLKGILKIPGEHNVSNALAALALARSLNIPDRISFKALSAYRGSWRRFETKDTDLGKPGKESKRITIVSDYGHHPTEIRATLKALLEKYPKRRIWLLFQPHQYQRTHYLFNDFLKVFRGVKARKTIITDIFDVSGREEKKITKKVSSEQLVKRINRKNVIYLSKNKILDYLKKDLRGGEILVIMGAGDIYRIQEQL